MKVANTICEKTGEVSYKLMLRQRFEQGGHAVGKDFVVYATADAPGGGFVSQCTVQGQAYQGAQASSKKLAEQEAAKAAMQILFPENALQLGKPAGKGAKASSAKVTPKDGVPKSDPQSRLRWALNLLLGRCVTKEDVVFETTEIEGGMFQSGCRLPNVPEYNEMVYTGEPASTRKDAETNAAKISMDQLEDLVAPLAEQKAEEKKIKELESKAKHAERMAAKGVGKGDALLGAV